MIKYQKYSKKKYIQKKNNVKSEFGVIKRKYSGVNKSKSIRLQNKETRLKTLFIILLKQSKFQKGFQHSLIMTTFIKD